MKNFLSTVGVIAISLVAVACEPTSKEPTSSEASGVNSFKQEMLKEADRQYNNQASTLDVNSRYYRSDKSEMCSTIKAARSIAKEEGEFIQINKWTRRLNNHECES